LLLNKIVDPVHLQRQCLRLLCLQVISLEGYTMTTLEHAAAKPAHEPHSYPHLTTDELAGRWRCRRETISRQYRKWGLRPIRIAGCLLFPTKQIEDVERRLIEANPQT
jgi:hypothetical protein